MILCLQTTWNCQVVWSYANGEASACTGIAPATHPIDSSNTSRHDMVVSESPPEGIVSHGTIQFAGQESQSTTEPCYPHLQAA